jgi:hypothetical protein
MLLISTAIFITSVTMTTLAMNAVPQDVTSPVWATPENFWFRVIVPGGYEWWSVDARHGVRERLFDHRRLAIELSAKAGTEYGPASLPFAEADANFVVKYDGVQAALEQGLAIEFDLSGDHWRCELHGEWDWGRTPPSDYYCAKKDDADAVGPLVNRSVSPNGQWEAVVQKDNVGVRQPGGTVRMLSTDGTPAAPYHLGSIEWSADSRVVSAYRVSQDAWRSAPTPGNVKAFVTRQEWTIARQASLVPGT